MAVRYEYSFTDLSRTEIDPETQLPVVVPVPMLFGLNGVSEDVAKGVRAGLRKVPSIADLHVERITENREAVTGPDPA